MGRLESFMKFREWMITSNWEEGLVLDKDLLITGNRCYHPETCCFISPEVNSFITRGNGLSGNTYIGYHFRKRNKSKPYQAGIGNPFTGKSEFLGDHFTELEAHLAWKKRKHELACMLADLQSDPRVAQALRTRYADLTTPYIP